MPENLRLTVPNFCRLSGYFYHFDSSADTLFKKTDSGENAFSYPLNSDVTNECKCLQTDGKFFYSLENVTTGNGQLIFKKWLIEDFVLKLQRTYTLTGGPTQKYDCNSFAVESFNRNVGVTAISGATTVTMDSNSRVDIGDILHFGPSTFTGDEGEVESVTVLSVLGGNQVTLTTPLTKSYNVGDNIVFAKRIWFFNKFRPSDTDPTNGSGQLYSFDINPVITTIVARKAGNEFRTVLASSFLLDQDYPGGARDFLVYANQTNLLFIETDTTNINFLNTVQSASQNNQETDSTVIPIHDLAYENKTIFRLQQKASYRNGATITTENFSPRYNYQVTVLTRLPNSISLTASPAVIAADSISTSQITAIVRDQFDQAIPSRSVSFVDSDTSGSPAGQMSPSSATTNSQGTCTVNYVAGTIPKTVEITATT